MSCPSHHQRRWLTCQFLFVPASLILPFQRLPVSTSICREFFKIFVNKCPDRTQIHSKALFDQFLMDGVRGDNGMSSNCPNWSDQHSQLRFDWNTVWFTHTRHSKSLGGMESEPECGSAPVGGQVGALFRLKCTWGINILRPDIRWAFRAKMQFRVMIATQHSFDSTEGDCQWTFSLLLKEGGVVVLFYRSQYQK